MRKPRVTADRRAEESPQGGLAPTAGRIQLSIGENRTRAQDSARRIAVRKLQEAWQRVAGHDGIGIEKEKVFAPRRIGAKVGCGGETDIGQLRQQMKMW